MKRKLLVLSCLALACLGCGGALARDLPDPNRTPGRANPNVTQQNIKRTICKSGWTDTIRPPVSYTNKLKIQQVREYRYKDKKPAHYEEDHLISLQLGGHPTNRRNLWPEAYAGSCGARVKDVLETKLKRQVCARQLSLRNAQRLIAKNWTNAYKRYVNSAGCSRA
jgi:hypothetical protein